MTEPRVDDVAVSGTTPRIRRGEMRRPMRRAAFPRVPVVRTRSRCEGGRRPIKGVEETLEPKGRLS